MTQARTTQRQAGPHRSAIFANPLCAVDGSPGSFLAVEQTAAMMGPGGELTLLEVTSARDRYESPAILPGAAADVLERAREIAEAAGVTTTAEVDPESPPPRVIVEWAGRYSLLAMGAPSTSWLAGAITASATDEAISRLPTALLIARDSASPQAARTTVVASDGTPGSDRLVELAVELAGQQGEVTLVHANGRRSRGAGELEAQSRALGEALDGRAHVDVRAGRAQMAILETAAALGAGLIVMGSRGLHGLRAIGSVSRHVMHEAHCSVLLVPPLHLGEERPAPERT
jgi:nucleotide-binding universal stress UspA family protein